MAILEIQDITHAYSPARKVLDDLTISLEAGKIYALMGSNGAGKTTLFNILSGFIQAKKGTVLFNGRKINGKMPYRINRLGISRTFQDLRIITKLSVKENIVLSMKQNPTDAILNALLPRNVYRSLSKALDSKAEEIIEQFFLKDVKYAPAGEISYGQQKLLTMACCVANGASLLLLDEPVAGIQPEYRNKIETLLKQLKEQGKTILFIEHNTEFIAGVADRIFFLHEGRISTFETIDQLRKDEQVMNAYI